MTTEWVDTNTNERDSGLEPEFIEHTSIQFSIPDVPYSAVKIFITDDENDSQEHIERGLSVAGYFRQRYIDLFGVHPPPTQGQSAQRFRAAPSGPSRPGPAHRGGGQGQGRAERYREADGECDICGGSVGIYPRTGNMRSDKIVCLGRCMDSGRDGRDYIHTVRWVDEDEPWADAEPY